MAAGPGLKGSVESHEATLGPHSQRSGSAERFRKIRERSGSERPERFGRDSRQTGRHGAAPENRNRRRNTRSMSQASQT